MIAHFPLDRLAAALRADGVPVVIRPGAQGRSARRFTEGYYQGCQAVVQHHSVSSGEYPLNDVNYIERGKGEGYVISNAYTALDGTVYLIASGPTYTEGTGGPYGIIPANRANDVAFSNEIASWGAVDSVYPEPPQQKAIASLAFHAAVIAAELWAWGDDPFAPHRCFSHFEWAPGRKVDPRGVSRWSPNGGLWDMDAFRSELRSRLTTPEDDDMIAVTDRPYDSDSPKGVYEFGPLDPGVVRKIPIVFGKRAKGSIMVETTAGRRGWVSLTGSPSTSGTSAITHFEPRPGAQIRTPWFDLEFPDGHGYISSHVPLARIVVDVQWIGQ